MATVTKPIALDESLNTTELSSRNVADVLAQELSAVATAIGGIAVPSADHVSYDNSGSGLSATDVQDAIDELSSEKVDKEVGKGLSTNDYTDAEKTKLAGIESGAEVNVQSDWNQTDNTADDYIKNKPSSEVKSATDTFTTVNGGLLSKCVIDLVPVQSGSGDPSPDNVRPISGHTEVGLYNVGKNNIPMVLSNIKSLNTSGTWNGNNYSVNGITFLVITDSDGNVTEVKILSGTATANANLQLCGSASLAEGVSYILNGCTNGSSSKYRISFYNSTLNAINNYFGGNTFTYSSGTGEQCYIRVFSGYTVPSGGHSLYPMIRLATETDFTFEPYLGHLYQVQIGSTVYGGYVDLVSGVMDVEYGYIASYNGETITEPWISDRDVYVPNTSPSTGAEVVYTLATPTTLNLTPQQIESLVGENNLSTPLDGQSIQTDGVKYREVFVFDDVEKVVNLRVPISMLGTDESGRTTASQAYASGDYFYKDGYMCKALTSISAGATLTLNTNYSQGTLADILKAIENA